MEQKNEGRISCDLTEEQWQKELQEKNVREFRLWGIQTKS